MKHRLLSAALVTVVATAPASLSAQQLSGKIQELVRFGTCDQALCLVTGPGVHQTHFLKSAQGASTDLVNFLTGAITASVARIPISATSSGTTFSFVNGVPVQSTTSSGPIYAERAATLGQKRVLVGVNTSHISYTKLRGMSTSDMVINLSHEDVGAPGLGDTQTEDDVIRMDIDMKLDLQVTSLFATYGLTDRLDVSLAVPFIMSSLKASAEGTIWNPTGTVTGLHVFGSAAAPSLTAHSEVSGSSSGVGDITARMKFNLRNGAKSGMAVLADVRIPTGDEKQFLGAGAVSADAMLVASATQGKFSPHANVGFAIRTGDSQNNALLGTFGFDQMINKKLTLALDVLAEMQAGGDEGLLPPDIHYTLLPTPLTVQGTNIPSKKDNPVSLSGGGRLMVGGFTVMANCLVPIVSGGMQSTFVWTLGIEKGF